MSPVAKAPPTSFSRDRSVPGNRRSVRSVATQTEPVSNADADHVLPVDPADNMAEGSGVPVPIAGQGIRSQQEKQSNEPAATIKPPAWTLLTKSNMQLRLKPSKADTACQADCTTEQNQPSATPTAEHSQAQASDLNSETNNSSPSVVSADRALSNCPQQLSIGAQELLTGAVASSPETTATAKHVTRSPDASALSGSLLRAGANGPHSGAVTSSPSVGAVASSPAAGAVANSPPSGPLTTSPYAGAALNGPSSSLLDTNFSTGIIANSPSADSNTAFAVKRRQQSASPGLLTDFSSDDKAKTETDKALMHSSHPAHSARSQQVDRLSVTTVAKPAGSRREHARQTMRPRNASFMFPSEAQAVGVPAKAQNQLQQPVKPQATAKSPAFLPKAVRLPTS